MKRQFTGTTGKIVLHALAWIIIIILPQFLSGRYFGNNRFIIWWFFVNTATYLVIFYGNYLFLVPKLFFANKKLIYFISALTLITSVYFLTEIANDKFFRRQRTERLALAGDSSTVAEQNYDEFQSPAEGRNFRRTDDGNRFQGDSQITGRTAMNQQDTLLNRMNIGDSTRYAGPRGNAGDFGPPSPPQQNNDRGPRPSNDMRSFFRLATSFQIYNYAVTALFFTFFSLGLKFMERDARVEQRQKELEKEKLDSELALLKNQVSPHFFFNTLNNIYSLIAINTDDSQDAVLKLSKLMRYLLYESEQGKTNLTNEFEFMINYIDLMRLRMSDKVTLSVQFPDTYDNFSIPPLLFIPFIENAFKHGISYREKSYINISIKMENKKLVFECKNSIGKKAGDEEEQYPGIGLDNVTKRLNLLFPGRHKLKIDKTSKDFHIVLEIDTKDLKENDQNHSN